MELSLSSPFIKWGDSDKELWTGFAQGSGSWESSPGSLVPSFLTSKCFSFFYLSFTSPLLPFALWHPAPFLMLHLFLRLVPVFKFAHSLTSHFIGSPYSVLTPASAAKLTSSFDCSGHSFFLQNLILSPSLLSLPSKMSAISSSKFPLSYFDIVILCISPPSHGYQSIFPSSIHPPVQICPVHLTLIWVQILCKLGQVIYFSDHLSPHL